MKLNTVNQAMENPLADAPGRLQELSKPASVTRAITSEVLFAGKRELLIQHAGDSYRLRITNQGKLILTK